MTRNRELTRPRVRQETRDKETNVITSQEIKQAVEKAGLKDTDDISAIVCEGRDGAKALCPVRVGARLRLVEAPNDRGRKGASGCAT
jgi:hypothetical protein